MSIVVGDEFTSDAFGIRLRVEHVFPAKDKQEATRYMRARPAVEESYMVAELDGPTPGIKWTTTATYLTQRCTRVHEEVI